MFVAISTDMPATTASQNKATPAFHKFFFVLVDQEETTPTRINSKLQNLHIDVRGHIKIKYLENLQKHYWNLKVQIQHQVHAAILKFLTL